MDIVVVLGSLAALIGAAIALYKARSERKKTAAETDLTEAETAEKYQLIADRAADRALRLDERVRTLETTVIQQQETIVALDAKSIEQQRTIELLQCENAALRSDVDEFDKVLIGAHVLHDQVVENGVTPKYKPPERRSRKAVV